MIKRRVLFYCIPKTIKVHDYGFVQEFLDAGFDEVLTVSESPDAQSGQISYAELSAKWDTIQQKDQQLYFMNTMLSEPLSTLSDLFEFMESNDAMHLLCDENDVYAQEKLPDDLFYQGDAKENFPLFLAFPSNSEVSRQCGKLLQTARSMEAVSDVLKKQFLTAGENETYFYHWKKHALQSTGTPVPYGVSVLDYTERGFPFAFLGIFRMYRTALIKYGTDDRPFRLLKLLQRNGTLLPCCANYLFSACDAAFLKENLQLDVIFPDAQQSQPQKLPGCAVFAHLYYEQDFQKNLRYLQNAAKYCDVYISVDSEEKRQAVISLAEEPLRSVMQVVLVQNRGRDLSALLVGFRSTMREYQYICFVHDKRSHADEADTVGAAFHSCIWDNLIGNGTVLPQMKAYFDDHPIVGLLVPPPPYWGVYMNTKADFWTICYDRTVSLARELGLHTTIHREINPVALGTAFWCRYEALQPLLERPWKYEDFDPEPLGVDGTFSHALERIFPYAALEQHFLTGWMLTDHFAEQMLESHVCTLDGMLRKAKEQNLSPLLLKETNYEIGVKLAFQLTVSMAGVLRKSLVRFVKKKLKCF